jgi:predicted ribosomally synthesized peptide with SipW-like signal peptide
MLIGTTYAWFTDSVVSRNNRIVTGKLDIALEYLNAEGNWAPVETNTNVFKDALWEPGHTEVVYLRASNQGSLSLKYQLSVNVAHETSSVKVKGENKMVGCVAVWLDGVRLIDIQKY